MKNIVGQIATKEDFYPRPQIVRRITRHLEAGAHIQLTAPRRVGKSSILHFFKDNPLKGYIFEYIDVESARTKQDFYRKLLKELLRNETLTGKKNLFKQFAEGANQFLSRLKTIKLGSYGEITLNEGTDIDYEEDLLHFLTGVDLAGDKLVIMVDEFPEVLLNIVDDAKGDPGQARSFLQSNRAFRNASAIRGKVQFLYTGSNSLNVTVAGLNSTELINDIAAIPVDPFHTDEAKDMVVKILGGYGYSISSGTLDHAVSTVEWHIPFYYQLLIQEIISAVDPGEEISRGLIDSSLVKISGLQNDHHFEHYVKRLKRIFSKEQLPFVQSFLNSLSQQDQMTKNQAMDMAHGMIPEDQAKRVLISLMHDGYIVTVEDDNAYKFNSIILKNWWNKHEC